MFLNVIRGSGVLYDYQQKNSFPYLKHNPDLQIKDNTIKGVG